MDHSPQIRVVADSQPSEGVVLVEVDAAELVLVELELSETVVLSDVESSQLVVLEIKRGE
jgi:hypothetical protein